MTNDKCVFSYLNIEKLFHHKETINRPAKPYSAKTSKYHFIFQPSSTIANTIKSVSI